MTVPLFVILAFVDPPALNSKKEDKKSDAVSVTSARHSANASLPLFHVAEVLMAGVSVVSRPRASLRSSRVDDRRRRLCLSQSNRYARRAARAVQWGSPQWATLNRDA